MSTDKFVDRHIGPRDHEIEGMLKTIGCDSMDAFIDEIVPKDIRMKALDVGEPLSEQEYLNKITKIAKKNDLFRSYIGMGYYGTNMPSVIKRNILENPSWYTSYTPYQAEISQGRLEALLNFQTVISELTGMPLANASLLDESTAVAEAMHLMYSKRDRSKVKAGANLLFVDENIFPQHIALLKTHAEPHGIELHVASYKNFDFTDDVFGCILQYPTADGKVLDYKEFVNKAHESKALVAVAADIMSLVLLTPPGEWGADMVVGNTQRFGIPMGFGGPHAAYFATKEEYKRNIPGRIIGVSVDMHGNKALRMALQTREQHIKRERATSNICTAQALLATMAGMYALYHGPVGLKKIAGRIHTYTKVLADKLVELGYSQENENYFDTLRVVLPDGLKMKTIKRMAEAKKVNFNYIDDQSIGISLDETVGLKDLNRIIKIFALANGNKAEKITEPEEVLSYDPIFKRETAFLTASCFNKYHSETEMMRYIKKLERKDFSLTHSMIPLGSCTMKLNPASAMFALSWPEFGNIHPFVPVDQAEGYLKLIKELEEDLCKITGFAAMSLQPNSGAAGEYTGLMVIRAYHKNRGEGHRNIVLIPASAHGTNPASAVMAGNNVVVVACDEDGNIDINDLRAKATEHKDNLSAFMVTYPSTHGVFESGIKEMMDIIHENGGQVYMDGANMNAQVGITNPGIIGADVCHLNLHKTFGIPHGGGGPGVGPIGVAKHLVDFLPSHPVLKVGGESGIPAVSAAPYGSASVFTITHAYIKMLGSDGLTKASQIAMLNANYIAHALKDYYGILYTGEQGRVAHEMILNCQSFKGSCNVETGDIARRLMDYGFHAPTLSFPVHETLMVEPTESESKQELDRFIEAMIAIRHEISDIEEGIAHAENNVMKNSPHTQFESTCDTWNHPYGRQKAVFPLKWVMENKFWPTVGKIDNGYGDRNLFCTCSALDD